MSKNDTQVNKNETKDPDSSFAFPIKGRAMPALAVVMASQHTVAGNLS